METYERDQINRLQEIDAVKYRDRNGASTNWLDVRDVQKRQAHEVLAETENFSFYYNMLEPFNGFPNVFTYHVALLIDQNQQLLDGLINGPVNADAVNQLRERYEREMDNETSVIYSCALDCVNWSHLIRHFANYNKNETEV